MNLQYIIYGGLLPDNCYVAISVDLHRVELHPDGQRRRVKWHSLFVPVLSKDRGPQFNPHTDCLKDYLCPETRESSHPWFSLRAIVLRVFNNFHPEQSLLNSYILFYLLPIKPLYRKFVISTLSFVHWSIILDSNLKGLFYCK